MLTTSAPRAGRVLVMITVNTSPPDQRPTTLFERLGGLVSIDAAVDRFYERVVADPELSGFFDGVDLRRQRTH